MIAVYASEVTGAVGTDWIGMIRHRAVRTIDAADPAGSDPFVNAGEATNVHSEIQARLRHQPAFQHDSRTCGDGPWTRWALVAVAATSCRIGGVDTLAKPGAPLVPSPASDAACSWNSAASSSAVRIAGTGRAGGTAVVRVGGCDAAIVALVIIRIAGDATHRVRSRAGRRAVGRGWACRTSTSATADAATRSHRCGRYLSF